MKKTTLTKASGAYSFALPTTKGFYRAVAAGARRLCRGGRREGQTLTLRPLKTTHPVEESVRALAAACRCRRRPGYGCLRRRLGLVRRRRDLCGGTHISDCRFADHDKSWRIAAADPCSLTNADEVKGLFGGSVAAGNAGSSAAVRCRRAGCRHRLQPRRRRDGRGRTPTTLSDSTKFGYAKAGLPGATDVRRRGRLRVLHREGHVARVLQGRQGGHGPRASLASAGQSPILPRSRESSSTWPARSPPESDLTMCRGSRFPGIPAQRGSGAVDVGLEVDDLGHRQQLPVPAPRRRRSAQRLWPGTRSGRRRSWPRPAAPRGRGRASASG